MEGSRSVSSGHLRMDDSWTCSRCGWVYPNPHPSAKHRRNHKKICGKTKSFELVRDKPKDVSSEENSSDEDHHGKETNEGIEHKSPQGQSELSVLTPESENCMSKLWQSDVIPETVSSICSARIETHSAEGLKPSDTSVETWSALVITSNQIKNSTTELKATVLNDPNLNETKVLGVKEKAIMVKEETGKLKPEIVNEDFLRTTFAEGAFEEGSATSSLAESDAVSPNNLSSDTVQLCIEEIASGVGDIDRVVVTGKSFENQTGYMGEDEILSDQTYRDGQSIHVFKFIQGDPCQFTTAIDDQDQERTESVDFLEIAAIQNGDPTKMRSTGRLNSEELHQNIRPELSPCMADELDGNTHHKQYDLLDKDGSLKTENALQELARPIPNENSFQDFTHSFVIKQACDAKEASPEKTTYLMQKVTTTTTRYITVSSESIEESLKQPETSDSETSMLPCNIILMSIDSTNESLEGIASKDTIKDAHSCERVVKQNHVQEEVDIEEKATSGNIIEDLKLPIPIPVISMDPSNQSIQQFSGLIINERASESKDNLEEQSLLITPYNEKDTPKSMEKMHEFGIQDAVNIEGNVDSVIMYESCKHPRSLITSLSPKCFNQNLQQHPVSLISEGAINTMLVLEGIEPALSVESTVNEVYFSDMIVKDNHLQDAVDLGENLDVLKVSKNFDTNLSNANLQNHFDVSITKREIQSKENVDSGTRLIMECNGRYTHLNARVVNECEVQDVVAMEDNSRMQESSMQPSCSMSRETDIQAVEWIQSSKLASPSGDMCNDPSNQSHQEQSDVLITKVVIESDIDQKGGLTLTIESQDNDTNSNTVDNPENIRIPKNPSTLTDASTIKSEDKTEETYSSYVVSNADSVDMKESDADSMNIKESDTDSVMINERLDLVKMPESSKPSKPLIDKNMDLASQNSQQLSDVVNIEKDMELNGIFKGESVAFMVERNGQVTHLKKSGLPILEDLENKFNAVKMDPTSLTDSSEAIDENHKISRDTETEITSSNFLASLGTGTKVTNPERSSEYKEMPKGNVPQQGDHRLASNGDREPEPEKDVPEKAESGSNYINSLAIGPTRNNQNEESSAQNMKLVNVPESDSSGRYNEVFEHHPDLLDACTFVGGIWQFQSLSDPSTRLDLGKAMSADNSPDKPIYPTERSSSLRVARKVFDTEDLKAPSPEAWQELSASESGSGRKNENARMGELNQSSKVHEEPKPARSRTALRNLMAKEGAGRASKNSGKDNCPKQKAGSSFWARCICCSTVH